MKRTISFILILCIMVSSSATVFAVNTGHILYEDKDYLITIIEEKKMGFLFLKSFNYIEGKV